jgi:hypothetical protein
MNNQNGSAIVIVMMLLTILTLVGVGMLIQTKIDTKYTKSKVSYDRTVNLADGAARVAIFAVRVKTIDTMKYSGHQERKFVGEADTNLTQTRGYWEAHRVLTGYSNIPPPGTEHKKYGTTYWLAEGGGAQARRWVSGQSYITDEVVAHGGSTYKRKSPGGAGSEPGSGLSWNDHWEPVAPNQSVVDVGIVKTSRE